MRRILLIIITLILLGGAVWLAARMRTQSTDARPVVGATISAVADIVRQVAGDNIRVVQIIPSGANPHTFEVTPSVVADVQDAKVIFAIGHGIDTWTSDIATTVPGVTVVTVDDGVTYRKLSFADDDAGADAGGLDPHYWQLPSNAKRIAEKVAWQLAARYPDQKEIFETNRDLFSLSVDEAAQDVQKMLDPYFGASIVLLHESVGYFTDAFGLKIVGVFEPTAGSEPTPQELAALQRTVQENNVKAVFGEPQLPEAVLLAFAQDLDVKTGVLDPGEASLELIRYQDLLRKNAQVIRDALQ